MLDVLIASEGAIASAHFYSSETGSYHTNISKPDLEIYRLHSVLLISIFVSPFSVSYFHKFLCVRLQRVLTMTLEQLIHFHHKAAFSLDLNV